jgi:hypothetical protein
MSKSARIAKTAIKPVEVIESIPALPIENVDTRKEAKEILADMRIILSRVQAEGICDANALAGIRRRVNGVKYCFEVLLGIMQTEIARAVSESRGQADLIQRLDKMMIIMRTCKDGAKMEQEFYTRMIEIGNQKESNKSLAALLDEVKRERVITKPDA